MKFCSIFLTLLAVSTALFYPNVFAQTPAPEKTKADTNREVIGTYARIYLEAQEYARAEQMISEYLILDSVDGNLWILLGETQIKAHKLSQACFSFQKAAALYQDRENKLYASYLFADCLNQGGRSEEAKVVLKQMIPDQGDLTTAPQDALNQMKVGTIRSGQALPDFRRRSRGKWRVSAAIGTGFDSNVLLVDEDVMNNTSVSDRGSFFVTPAVQVGYLGDAFGTAFDSRYISSFTDYLNSEVQSFNSFYQRADLSFGSGPIRWGAFGDMLFLNRDPFQVYDWELGGSYLNIRHATANYVMTWEIPIKFQKYTLDSNTGSDNDRTGEDMQFKATMRWIKDTNEFFNLQAIADAQYTLGSNYRLVGLDVPALYLTRIPGFSSLGLVNTFTAEAQVQYYLDSDTTRRDLLLKADVGLLKSVGSGLNLTLDYGYQMNLSSVTDARYNKNVVSLQLAHDFL